MTVVVGTAGHIDHGKTTLLRALTGIDADRLPEERRRGMTIDLGFAHLALPDGPVVDFVDVPGHDRLVGNMLVGAGEIDASLLVVAADDGPRAQTHEHLALLRALDVAPALVVVTKIDAVPEARVAEVTAALRDLVGAETPIVAASGVAGAGLDEVRSALAALVASVTIADRPASLAVDRSFAVKGRGTVVTGTLRGGPLAVGDRLRVVPGEREVRVRAMQVHGEPVERVERGGRLALNLSGVELTELHRGLVLTADPRVVASDRALVGLPTEPPDRSRWRLHLGTAAADATVARAARDALPGAGIVRMITPVAARPGDGFVLRRDGVEPAGGVILDVRPPRGLSRRRQTAERVATLAATTGQPEAHDAARLDLHGVLVTDGRAVLAEDVADAGAAAVLAAVEAAGSSGVSLPAARSAGAAAVRRLATVRREEAGPVGAALVDRLVAARRLVRDGDVVRLPGSAPPAPDPELAAAMDRLEAALATLAPTPLTEAARATGCPTIGIRALERAGRIVVLGPDLAYAMSTYRELAATALRAAARAPLTPAAFRDATGTSRKYVMPILEDLDRRAILRRTPAGHVPGPRAPRSGAAS